MVTSQREGEERMLKVCLVLEVVGEKGEMGESSR